MIQNSILVKTEQK